MVKKILKRRQVNHVPMVDLQAQYQAIKDDLDSAISEVIAETSFVGGDFVAQFEKDLANYLSIPYAVGVNSGTDALYLSLVALGIGEGDEVITTPFTFFATAEVIAQTGARPVFVDIKPDTFNINPNKIADAVTKNTKAIIPVHLYGMPAEIKQIREVASMHDLYVIEDACQAIGASIKKKKVGIFGKTGCFSFFPSKNLGAYGDGGAIVTDDKKIFNKLLMLRNHGSKKKYYNENLGYSSRLDGLQAAILSAKLPYLDEWNQLRRKHAKTYTSLIGNVEGITTPKYDFDSVYYHVFHQYTLRVKRRSELMAEFKSQSISSMIYYPVPLHLLPAFDYLGYEKGDFPVAERASEEVMSLPIYPELEDYVIHNLAKFFV